MRHRSPELWGYAPRAVQFHPPWGSNRFRLAPRTYAAWGCIVRVVSQTKSRKIPTQKILPLFPAIRSDVDVFNPERAWTEEELRHAHYYVRYYVPPLV